MEGSELIELADALDRHRDEFESKYASTLRGVADTAADFTAAWSGSNLGYHSCVYYERLQSPPPGAHFSMEWGLGETMASGATRGNWCEYRREDVVNAIYKSAGDLDLAPIRAASEQIANRVEAARADVVSALTVAVADHDDSYLRKLRDEAEKAAPPSAGTIVRSYLPRGQLRTRDSIVTGQGLRPAPHQVVMAEMDALNAPSVCAKELAGIARQAGSHLVRLARRTRRDRLVGTNVFVGHGRSLAWRVLKDFVKDRLGLPYDEFNRVPVAGVTNIARLSEMLDAAAIAFIILTAEDEQADGKLHARMNVIHEVGLFQGRLGFTKAVVLLEEGCEQFSNIQGLGQIRFPRGNIAAAFEEVRLVLEREELIKS